MHNNLALSSTRALILGLALALCLSATPTTITDTLLQPNGSPAAGVDFKITQLAFFSGGNYYPAWALTPHPVTDSTGHFSFGLEPNPAGQLYTVTLTQPNGVVTSSCWSVPVSGSPVTVLAVLSTACGTPPLSIVSVGQIPTFGSVVGTGAYGVYLPNPTYPAAYVIASASSGDVDLYTVPANRRALLLGGALTINSGSPRVRLETKIGGSYYLLSGQSPFLSVTYGDDLFGDLSFVAPRVLNAGETASVNLTVSGVSVWLHLVEFDATSPLRSVTLTTFSAGDNTLYTVPVGKTFELLPSLSPFTQAQVGQAWYSNNSGQTRTLSVYAVPGGGSAGPNNSLRLNTSASGSAPLPLPSTLYGSLAPGDFVDVKVDSNASGQMAWMNIIEH